MTFREEFEKAYKKEFYPRRGANTPTPADAALWAAKFTAERCAQIGEQFEIKDEVSSKIRQLAKELS